MKPQLFLNIHNDLLSKLIYFHLFRIYPLHIFLIKLFDIVYMSVRPSAKMFMLHENNNFSFFLKHANFNSFSFKHKML